MSSSNIGCTRQSFKQAWLCSRLHDISGRILSLKTKPKALPWARCFCPLSSSNIGCARQSFKQAWLCSRLHDISGRSWPLIRFLFSLYLRRASYVLLTLVLLLLWRFRAEPFLLYSCSSSCRTLILFCFYRVEISVSKHEMYISKHETAISKHETYISKYETEILAVCGDNFCCLRRVLQAVAGGILYRSRKAALRATKGNVSRPQLPSLGTARRAVHQRLNVAYVCCQQVGKPKLGSWGLLTLLLLLTCLRRAAGWPVSCPSPRPNRRPTRQSSHNIIAET